MIQIETIIETLDCLETMAQEVLDTVAEQRAALERTGSASA